MPSVSPSTRCKHRLISRSAPTTPRLAGQYAEYMVIQMQDYQDANRAIPPVAVPMRGMLAGMSEEDIKALAHFYASQK